MRFAPFLARRVVGDQLESRPRPMHIWQRNIEALMPVPVDPTGGLDDQIR
jgi:hypothetical protein